MLGVCGSIAAYKAPALVRLLREAGHEVRVVATDSALRFIGAPALAAVSGSPVSTGVFDDPAAVEHIELGQWAQLVIIAPASADTLSRLAAGRADDLLAATVLSTTAPVVAAPAMHTQMWLNPATAHNVATLRERGVRVIDPDSGRLTGSDTGLGRLPEPERIMAEALDALEECEALEMPRAPGAGGDAEDAVGASGGEGAAPDRSLAGRHVVVSAGGTREPIDPVRYLGNRSSGRQGAAVVRAAARLGARVTLVSANIGPEVLAGLPPGTEVLPVGTALELAEAVRAAAADADVVVMAAAVADFRPARPAAAKIKKSAPGQPGAAGAAEAGAAVLELVANPDVLAGLAQHPPRHDGGRTLLVGFAAETGDAQGDVLTHGAAKARRKGADLLAVNAVGEGIGFGDVPNAVVVLGPDGREVARARGSKDEVAERLMGLVAERLDPGTRPVAGAGQDGAPGRVSP